MSYILLLGYLRLYGIFCMFEYFMLLLDWIFLFPSAMVGHSRMTKNSGANTVRKPQIQ